MRRWFVFLLVALLPLRGWVGEAMAGDMLAQHLQPIAAEATSTAAAQAIPKAAPAAEHDCAGHGSESPDDPAPSSQACPTCAACQVCSAVALAFDTGRRGAEAHAAAPAPMARTPFASAEPTAAFKPPIS